MIESLVITLREGIEAALVVGIILAYLNKTGMVELKRHVYSGLILAIAASIAGAIIFNLIGFDPENEVLEGIMFFTAAIFVGSMVIWMQKTSKNIKGDMEKKLHKIVNEKNKSDLKKQGIGVLAFTFFMVFREGIETVLFMAAVSVGTNPIMSVLGGLFGITIAFIFAVFFIRGSLKINLERFFKVTSWILMLLVLRLFAGGLHEFGEVSIIPLNPLSMKIIGLIVRDSSTVILSMILLTLPIVMILMDKNKEEKKGVDNIQAGSNIDKRKRLAEIQKSKRWKAAVVSTAVAINLILGTNLVVQAMTPKYDPTPTAITAEEGMIKIPLDDLKVNIMSKFAYNVDGTDVNFILVKGYNQEDVKTGLDACEICGPLGYFQEPGNDEEVICKNCNAPIPIPTIGYPGGCNPVALDSEVVDGEVIIKVEDIQSAKDVFAE